MIDVFISYARPDHTLAAALQVQLEQAHWSVWRDSRLESGEDFREQIEQALEGARVTVVLWSEASRKSRWVRSEAERAASLNRLMAVRLEDVPPPLGLDQLQATNLLAWHPGEAHDGLDTLLDQLSLRLGRTSKAREDDDARAMRRLRRLVREAKASTLLALAAAPLGLLLHGSGILDSQLKLDTRLRLLSVQARSAAVDRALDERIVPVVLDEKTVEELDHERRDGKPVGPFSASWRVLHAELLTNLAAAGAKVVAFDVAFPKASVPTPLAEHGTQQLAEAIVNARQQGTSVVIAAMTRDREGELAVAPAIREALERPLNAAHATARGEGAVAVPCVGFREGGATLGPVLFTNPAGPHPGVRSLALASVEALWDRKVQVMPSEQRVVLSGTSGEQPIEVAGFGRKVGADSDCLALRESDRPVHQLLDLHPRELVRSHGAVPYEHILRRQRMPDVKDKLVLVGTQLTLAGEQDRHWVFQCDDSPWSCGPHKRWGMNLQVDMANNLLRGTAIRALGPVQQLMMMIALCFATAWLRLSMAQRPPRKRRAWFLALVGADLTIGVVAGIAFHVLMDSTYHVLAMAATYAAVSRLEKRGTGRVAQR